MCSGIELFPGDSPACSLGFCLFCSSKTIVNSPSPCALLQPHTPDNTQLHLCTRVFITWAALQWSTSLSNICKKHLWFLNKWEYILKPFLKMNRWWEDASHFFSNIFAWGFMLRNTELIFKCLIAFDHLLYCVTHVTFWQPQRSR